MTEMTEQGRCDRVRKEGKGGGQRMRARKGGGECRRRV